MSMARVAAPGRSVFRHLAAKRRSAQYESSLVNCPGCKSAVPDGGRDLYRVNAARVTRTYAR